MGFLRVDPVSSLRSAALHSLQRTLDDSRTFRNVGTFALWCYLQAVTTDDVSGHDPSHHEAGLKLQSLKHETIRSLIPFPEDHS